MAELIAAESLLPLRSISSITPERPWKSIADWSEKHVFASVRYSPCPLRFIWLRSWTRRYRNPIRKLILCCSFIDTAFSPMYINKPRAHQRRTERTISDVGAFQRFEHVTTKATAVTLVWNVAWTIFSWTGACHHTVKLNTMVFSLSFWPEDEKRLRAHFTENPFSHRWLKLIPKLSWNIKNNFLPFEFY